MSEIQDRRAAAPDIDPIVAAPADDMANDTLAAAAVEGFGRDADAGKAIEAAEGSENAPIAVHAVLLATGGTVEFDADDAPGHATEVPDAAAGGLSAEVVLHAADFTIADLTLASEAMPAALAGAGDEAKDAFGEGPASGTLPESDALDAAPFNHPAAYVDTVVELEAPLDEVNAELDAPLLDGELEDGIASVFAALHAAAMDGATPPVEPLGELQVADGVTFRLLGELDRLWHRAA